VVNSYNATFKLAKEALEALQTHYPEFLLPTIIRQCTKFAQASSEGRPVFVADPTCKGATDIQALIDHVLPRMTAAAPKAGAKTTKAS
jgi:chromosome partitioning protein